MLKVSGSAGVVQETARIGAVGDTGNRTGTGPGDHGVATLCDHWGDLCPRFQKTVQTPLVLLRTV